MPFRYFGRLCIGLLIAAVALSSPSRAQNRDGAKDGNLSGVVIINRKGQRKGKRNKKADAATAKSPYAPSAKPAPRRPQKAAKNATAKNAAAKNAAAKNARPKQQRNARAKTPTPPAKQNRAASRTAPALDNRGAPAKESRRKKLFRDARRIFKDLARRSLEPPPGRPRAPAPPPRSRYDDDDWDRDPPPRRTRPDRGRDDYDRDYWGEADRRAQRGRSDEFRAARRFRIRQRCLRLSRRCDDGFDRACRRWRRLCDRW